MQALGYVGRRDCRLVHFKHVKYVSGMYQIHHLLLLRLVMVSYFDFLIVCGFNVQLY